MNWNKNFMLTSITMLINMFIDKQISTHTGNCIEQVTWFYKTRRQTGITYHTRTARRTKYDEMMKQYKQVMVRRVCVGVSQDGLWKMKCAVVKWLRTVTFASRSSVQSSSHFYNEYEIIFADKNSDLSV